MGVDPQLHARLRRQLGLVEGVKEKRMIGGLCVMVGGHMCCGISGGGLMVRVGAQAYADALAREGVRPLSVGGRSPKGYVVVDARVLDDSALARWTDAALAFVATLPPRG